MNIRNAMGTGMEKTQEVFAGPKGKRARMGLAAMGINTAVTLAVTKWAKRNGHWSKREGYDVHVRLLLHVTTSVVNGAAIVITDRVYQSAMRSAVNKAVLDGHEKLRERYAGKS